MSNVDTAVSKYVSRYHMEKAAERLDRELAAVILTLTPEEFRQYAIRTVAFDERIEQREILKGLK